MMEPKTKRVRGTNFSPEEKLLCLNLVKQYSHIIENKKTDALTWKSKELTWIKITNEFNAQNSCSTFRSKEALKRFYENKKKETRKAAANERRETTKTGGGVAVPIIKDPTFDLTMSILNKKTVFGFDGICDGDQLAHSSCRDNDRVTTKVPQTLQEITEEEDEKEEETEAEEDRVFTNNNSNINTPVSLSAPETENLITKRKVAKSNTNSRWSSRRRSILCPTGNVAKKYEDLGEVKLQIAQVQLELLHNERRQQQEKFKNEIEETERKRKREDDFRKMEIEQYERKKVFDLEEFELRKKSLELDIKLKEAQLKALQLL